MHRTLPPSLRRKEEDDRTSKEEPFSVKASEGPSSGNLVFGLHLNLPNFISGGVSTFLGQFRRKTPSQSTPPSAPRPAVTPPPEMYRESYELIEFSSSYEDSQTGVGHEFSEVSTFNPTWCDHCGQLIWGLYDDGGSRCRLCELTCHEKCQSKVRLDCSHKVLSTDKEEDTLRDVSEIDEDDESTLKGIPAISSAFQVSGEVEDSLLPNSYVECLLVGDELESAVGDYNKLFPPGQKTTLNDDETYNGFVRVSMNLHRPINVISGMRPPSIYKIDDSLESRKTLTSFYLPPDTVKALHINSTTSTRDVIRFLLAKFRVADNPHKFALYERHSPSADSARENKRTLSRALMRRLPENELPLNLSLQWVRRKLLDQRTLVLQENDPGEICWETFSFPELKNFLIILDREEAWYKKSIHEKYDTILRYMEKLLEEKRKTIRDS